MRHKILVVEDDKSLQETLTGLFIENGFLVDSAPSGASALKKAENSPPDLVVLDLGLPDITGEDVCRKLKKILPEMPIIILTAKDTKADIVRGLNIGADDYLSKPFEMEELLARIRARLRKGGTLATVVKVADLVLDNQKIIVKRGEKEIKLTPKEFQLLEYLMRNRGIVLDRETILNRVWSYPSEIESRAVDVYIGYLRKKIDHQFTKKLIHSVKGFGYTIRE